MSAPTGKSPDPLEALGQLLGATGNERHEGRSRSPRSRLVNHLQEDEDFWDGILVARQYVADLQEFLKLQKSIIEFQERTLRQMDVTLETTLQAKKESEPKNPKKESEP